MKITQAAVSELGMHFTQVRALLQLLLLCRHYGFPQVTQDDIRSRVAAQYGGQMTFHPPLDEQFVEPVTGEPAYPYSLFYVYYDQYNYIRGVAVQSVALALAAVLLASYLVSSGQVALFTTVMVASVTLGMIGWVWVLNPSREEQEAPAGPNHEYGVDINAVSVVNLVTAGMLHGVCALLYPLMCLLFS